MAYRHDHCLGGANLQSNGTLHSDLVALQDDLPDSGFHRREGDTTKILR